MYENTTISSLNDALAFFILHTKHSYNLQELYQDIDRRSENWTDFKIITEQVTKKLNETHDKFSENLTNSRAKMSLCISTDCIIFNKLYYDIMPIVHQQFCAEDENLFEKCKELCSLHVTAERFGAPDDFAIPLLASVVELSTLDNYKSPLEKINCLCTAYDLIFAELKTALVDIIAQYSDTEASIPVINNSEVIPILMTVIVKSKLMHLYSNLQYIDSFLGSLNDTPSIRHVLSSYIEAVNRLILIEKASLAPECGKVCTEMTLTKFIEITSGRETFTKPKKLGMLITLLDKQMERITDLIIASTHENYG